MMAENNAPQEMFIVTRPSAPTVKEVDYEPRRNSVWEGVAEQASSLQVAGVEQLREQVNIFLQQINVVISDAPEKVGGFRLEEFEVSAEVKVEAKGEIKLALLAGGELGGGVGGGLKFVFKRVSAG